MHHAPEAIMRNFLKREAQEAVPEKQRNFRREDCHADVDEQHNGCEAGEQSDYQERAANDFACSNKRAHYVRSRNADFGKAPGAKFRRKKKFLNGFGQENAAYQNSHEKGRGRCIRMKEVSHRTLNLRRELGEIVDAESFLDYGHLIRHLFKFVLAEELVFFLFEILTQGIEFMRLDVLLQSRKENRVLAGVGR